MQQMFLEQTCKYGDNDRTRLEYDREEAPDNTLQEGVRDF